MMDVEHIQESDHLSTTRPPEHHHSTNTRENHHHHRPFKRPPPLPWEKYESEEEAALGRGKRQRKVVSYREAYAPRPIETLEVNRLRMESGEEDAPLLHHVEGAFVETLLPKAKTPPQDTLLKLEKEQSFREPSQASSLFIFKLGLAKLECSLLMNGLVHDYSEDALMNAINSLILKELDHGLIFLWDMCKYGVCSEQLYRVLHGVVQRAVGLRGAGFCRVQWAKGAWRLCRIQSLRQEHGARLYRGGAAKSLI